MQTQTQSIGKLYSQQEKQKVSYENINIYVGIDAHLKSWKVTIMTEHLVYKTFSQDPKPELLNHCFAFAGVPLKLVETMPLLVFFTNKRTKQKK